MLIENSEEQGSPAANAGAYLTLYKERKKKREEEEKRRHQNQHNNQNQPIKRRDCGYGFFYGACD